jgi:hypothetical protein
VRSDGRKVNTDYNIWFSLINHKVYLNFLDYVPTAGQLYTYSFSLSTRQSAQPVFNIGAYYVNVTERTPYRNPVLNVSASNSEPSSVMTYSLNNYLDLFSINSTTGQLHLTNVLHYEDSSAYSLVVTAVDDGTPPQTGTALISVSVIDINDNSPVFKSMPSDISLKKECNQEL